MGDVIQMVNGMEFRTQKELLQYSNTLYLIVDTAVAKNKELEDKVKHLQDLLDSLAVTPIIKSRELCMVEEQIDRFAKDSMIRQLSSEEIKSLDVLIKNKLLLSGEATTINGEKKKKEYTSAQLISIAKQKE